MKKIIVVVAFVGALGIGSTYEWRYSADMQEHIDSVNNDLERARLEASYSTGLIGSLQAMTSATNVAAEIISTHEHVHTVKDEVLAWKIKKTVEDSVTVRDSIQNVIAKWPESI